MVGKGAENGGWRLLMVDSEDLPLEAKRRMVWEKERRERTIFLERRGGMLE